MQGSPSQPQANKVKCTLACTRSSQAKANGVAVSGQDEIQHDVNENVDNGSPDTVPNDEEMDLMEKEDDDDDRDAWLRYMDDPDKLQLFLSNHDKAQPSLQWFSGTAPGNGISVEVDGRVRVTRTCYDSGCQMLLADADMVTTEWGVKPDVCKQRFTQVQGDTQMTTQVLAGGAVTVWMRHGSKDQMALPHMKMYLIKGLQRAIGAQLLLPNMLEHFTLGGVDSRTSRFNYYPRIRSHLDTKTKAYLHMQLKEPMADQFHWPVVSMLRSDSAALLGEAWERTRQSYIFHPNGTRKPPVSMVRGGSMNNVNNLNDAMSGSSNRNEEGLADDESETGGGVAPIDTYQMVKDWLMADEQLVDFSNRNKDWWTETARLDEVLDEGWIQKSDTRSPVYPPGSGYYEPLPYELLPYVEDDGEEGDDSEDEAYKKTGDLVSDSDSEYGGFVTGGLESDKEEDESEKSFPVIAMMKVGPTEMMGDSGTGGSNDDNSEVRSQSGGDNKMDYLGLQPQCPCLPIIDQRASNPQRSLAAEVSDGTDAIL
jgi:hypothetical protein